MVNEEEKSDFDHKVDPDENKYPFSVCWSPYSGICQFVPIAGHVSIGDSRGRTHDFNDIAGTGNGTVSVGEVSYGIPYKYVKLGVVTLKLKPNDLDKAIETTSKEFEGKPYSMF